MFFPKNASCLVRYKVVINNLYTLCGMKFKKQIQNSNYYCLKLIISFFSIKPVNNFFFDNRKLFTVFYSITVF